LNTIEANYQRAQQERDRQWRENQKVQENKREKFLSATVDQIVLSDELDTVDKMEVLQRRGYSNPEAWELLKSAEKSARKAKLRDAKRKISDAVWKQTGAVGLGYERQPIPEDVRAFVWRRDQARCVKCGSNKNLEFDHIIPVSRGGSNTERNIQLLCEGCNREKSASI